MVRTMYIALKESLDAQTLSPNTVGDDPINTSVKSGTIHRPNYM